MTESKPPIRVRFAPSPTGHLHVGNARTALFNWLFARGQKGSFILRIEDTDVERSQAEFERQLLEDIHWLGLDWNEGPDVGGPHGPYRQSERTDIYRKHGMKLVESGHAYYCFCTPLELEADRKIALGQGRQPRYSGKCRPLSKEEVSRRREAGEPASTRLKISEEVLSFPDLVHGLTRFSPDAIGDFILLRPGGQPAYNFAVVVDDHLMQISHVIRGDDHISNTPRQVAVYRALGWELPQFAHLSTILAGDRTRLSKRHGATSVDHFREMGLLPEAITNYLALLGWSAADGVTEILSREQLTAQFSLAHIIKSPAVFDLQKLFWLNRHYMKGSPLERLVKLSLPVLRSAGYLGEQVGKETEQWLELVLGAVLKNVDHLTQLPDPVRLIFHFDGREAVQAEENKDVIESEDSRRVVDSFCQKIAAAGELDSDKFRALISEVRNETGQKGKNLFHPIRVALTGRTSGPEMDKLVPIFEQGAKLSLPNPVKNCAERAREFARFALKGAAD